MVQTEKSDDESLTLNTFRGVPVLTLVVGPDNIPYHVHQNLLFDASPVLKAALSGKFKESENSSMNLPDDDADAMEHVVCNIPLGYDRACRSLLPCMVFTKRLQKFMSRRYWIRYMCLRFKY